MTAREKLSNHLKGRLGELARKPEGVKIVGYYPSEYMPEELVLSCGAIPVGLCRGGEYDVVEQSGSYVTRWYTTFCKAQVGYVMMKADLLYQLPDLVVIPVVDHQIRILADFYNTFTDMDVHRIAVPHEKTAHAFQYYLEEIQLFKQKLEEVTGNEITEAKLTEAINLCNRERELLKEISLLRKVDNPPLTGRDFITLNHDSYVADKKVMVEVLESYYQELQEREAPPLKGPRILVTGDALARGDYKVIDLVEKSGGDVVIEQYSEALKDYWENVPLDGDPIKNLAERYLLKKVCHGSFRRDSRERLDFIIKLAKDFNVNGLIWYQTMYRACFDMESYYFINKILKESLPDLPTLMLETDYDHHEVGAFATRIGTFIDMIKM